MSFKKILEKSNEDQMEFGRVDTNKVLKDILEELARKETALNNDRLWKQITYNKMQNTDTIELPTLYKILVEYKIINSEKDGM